MFQLKMQALYPNGEPAKHTAVEISCEEGNTIREKTDSDGRLELKIRSKFIYSIKVGNHTVKENWVTEDLTDADERYELPAAQGSPVQGDAAGVGGDAGFRGRLFYSDGTAVAEELRVEAELPGRSIRVSEYSDQKGRFTLPIPYEPNERHRQPLNLYVRGQRIDPARINYSGARYAVIVLPPMLGKRGGDSGGLVTGRVVDSNGDPYEGAKITAQVVSGSMLGIFSSKFAEARSRRGGYFALEFDGGTEIKNLSIDGNDPLKVTRKRKDGQEVEIDTDRYKAGSFGLTLVRRKKILGIW